MDSDDATGRPPGLRERLEANALPTVLAITALALLVRLDGLGERVAHWDEGRVAFDVLRYGETGLWEYRPIVHGPFLPHVNDLVFAALGPTDFAMRLVVAVVGGLLPLAPWLFRRHVRPLEVIATSLFLAFTPILVYYSRFMRNDVLVAAFMLFALGMFVRFLDTYRVRYLYAGLALAALGFTTKENAIIYVLCWIGAAALLADTALFRPHGGPSTGEYVRRTIGRVRDRVRARAGDRRVGWLAGYYGGHLALAAALAAAILVVFYAPRTGGTGVGFERLASNPGLAPEVADEAISSFWEGVTDWGERSGEDGDYDSLFGRFRDYFGGFLDALATYAAGFVAFAVAGIVGERYLADRPRPIVMFFAYWGVVSVPGYALGMDIWAAWALVHALVPLALPAGVALGHVFEWGLDAAAELRLDGRRGRSTDAVLSVSVAAVLVLSMLVGTAGTAFDPTNTRDSGEDHIVQYAQPNQDLRATLDDLEAAVDTTGDPVLYYGSDLAIDNESAAHRPPVTDRWTEDEHGTNRKVEDNGDWYRRLPLQWYTERMGADRLSAHNESDLARTIRDEEPVAIVTKQEYDDVNNERIVDGYAGDYVKVVHELRSPGDEVVFYLREDALAAVHGEGAA